MSAAGSADPFALLGVSQDADEAKVRTRYLELVKQYPPERDPEKFREIRAAFEAARNPLSIANRLIAPPGDGVPQWSDVLEAQKRNPPRLAPAFLLSLGNRGMGDAAASVGPPEPNRSGPNSAAPQRPEQQRPEQQCSGFDTQPLPDFTMRQTDLQ
jgi:hypothetical protein